MSLSFAVASDRIAAWKIPNNGLLHSTCFRSLVPYSGCILFKLKLHLCKPCKQFFIVIVTSTHFPLVSGLQDCLFVTIWFWPVYKEIATPMRGTASFLSARNIFKQICPAKGAWGNVLLSVLHSFVFSLRNLFIDFSSNPCFRYSGYFNPEEANKQWHRGRRKKDY